MAAEVLIIGGGGREHALAVSVMASPLVNRVYMTSCNAGCERFAMPENIDIGNCGDYSALARFCQKRDIALVIIGPEAPLAAGAADVLRAEGLAVFGPSQKAAKIEYSKIYAKKLMDKNNIPTLGFAVCEDDAQVAKWCAARRPPFVIKADSLAAGKGVFICESAQLAQQSAAQIRGGKFGGRGVIAEEYCGGAETSFIVITDGKSAIPLPSSCDYKRLYDGGKGANTGGMGAVSPSPFFDASSQETVMRDIIHPTLAALADDGAPFCGFLYAGLVRDDDDKWRVLEFNCRMGDPEAQAILPRLRGDIYPLLLAAAEESSTKAGGGGFDKVSIPSSAGVSVCVVLAADGYPQKPVIGDVITMEDIPHGIRHYYAATKRGAGGEVITNGGRVMSVVAVGDDNESAIQLAYRGAAGVKFRNMHYRKDIGKHTIIGG